VARLYFAYFDRTPDIEGFDYCITQRERGRHLDPIADEWASSREIEMRYGSLDIAFSESPAFRAASANEVFVSIAYAEILGRSAAPAQLTPRVGFLDAGNSGEAVIRALLAAR
jgi:hypothetical protein